MNEILALLNELAEGSDRSKETLIALIVSSIYQRDSKFPASIVQKFEALDAAARPWFRDNPSATPEEIDASSVEVHVNALLNEIRQEAIRYTWSAPLLTSPIANSTVSTSQQIEIAGNTEPDASVSLRLGDSSATVVADSTGFFTAHLTTPQDAGKYQIAAQITKDGTCSPWGSLPIKVQ